MYTVSKGPSKFVAKTRRGVPQNFERLENFRDSTKKSNDVECIDNIASVPKPVFYNTARKTSQVQREPDVISPQHEEIIRFVRESWSSVCMQYHRHYTLPKEPSLRNSQTIVYYDDGDRSNVLQDFKPFDLELWWGKRIFNSITKAL